MAEEDSITFRVIIKENEMTQTSIFPKSFSLFLEDVSNLFRGRFPLNGSNFVFHCDTCIRDDNYHSLIKFFSGLKQPVVLRIVFSFSLFYGLYHASTIKVEPISFNDKGSLVSDKDSSRGLGKTNPVSSSSSSSSSVIDETNLLCYYSDEGFNEGFKEKAMEIFSSINLPDYQEYHLFLYQESQLEENRFLPLGTDPHAYSSSIFSSKKHDCIFLKARAYSSVRFEQLSPQITVKGFETSSTMEILQHLANAEENLPHFYEDSEESNIFSRFYMIKDMVKFIFVYLMLLRINLNQNKSQRESNRRLLVNIFLLMVSSMASLTFDTEYHFQKSDLIESRVGEGPLDYIVSYGFDADNCLTQCKKPRLVRSAASYVSVLTLLIRTKFLLLVPH
jgi:hypothetical protein